MTNRVASHMLEARSRDRVRAAFHDAGFTADDLHEDYGEDMLVRVFKHGRATPYSFFVQVKATQRHRNRCTVRLRTSHVQHWKRLVQPVFVVLWDARTGVATWENVSREMVERGEALLNQKTIALRVPPENLLDQQGVRRMANIARESFELVRRERDAAMLLCGLLKKHAGIDVIEYSPREFVLVTRHAKRGEDWYVFGELAEFCTLQGWDSRQLGTILASGARQMLKRVRFLAPDGPVVHLDEAGAEVRRFATRAEHAFFHRARIEAWDLEEDLLRLRQLAPPNQLRTKRAAGVMGGRKGGDGSRK